MDPLAQYAAMALIALGGLFIALNWGCLVATLIERGRRFYSCVPPLGGVLAAVGCCLVPALRPWWWLALIMDAGTWILLFALPRLSLELWNTSDFNLMHEYVARAGPRTVWMRLLKKEICVVKQEITRPSGECGITGASELGAWEPNEHGYQLAFGERRLLFAFAQPGDQSRVQWQSGRNQPIPKNGNCP